MTDAIKVPEHLTGGKASQSPAERAYKACPAGRLEDLRSELIRAKSAAEEKVIAITDLLNWVDENKEVVAQYLWLRGRV